jgi:hypothetical protein
MAHYFRVITGFHPCMGGSGFIKREGHVDHFLELARNHMRPDDGL